MSEIREVFGEEMIALLNRARLRLDDATVCNGALTLAYAATESIYGKRKARELLRSFTRDICRTDTPFGGQGPPIDQPPKPH